MKRHLLAAALALLAGAAPSPAAVVFDNGAPDLVNALEMTGWILAEDFTLAALTNISGVVFWALESPTTYQGSFSWAIHANNAGTPSAALQNGTGLAVTRESTGRSAFGLSEYKYTFGIAPTNLAAGSYWLALHNGPLTTTIPTGFYWGTAPTVNGARARMDEAPFEGAFTATTRELAYQLTTVPEPGVSTALLGGLTLLGGMYRGRRS